MRAVANAFQNDEAIDPAVLTELALSQLESVHIRALTKLVEFSDSLGPWPDEDTEAHAHHERTGQMMEVGQQIPQPVLVTLVNAGVVMQSTNVFGGGTHLHGVSPFGREIIRGLRSED